MKSKALFLAALLPVAILCAQGPSVEPMSKELKTQTLESVISAMNEQYVFPDLAKQVEADLKKRMAAGEYDSVNNGPELARLLTSQMNAICKDAHLNVSFSKDPLPKRENRRAPSKEEVHEMQKGMRLMNGGILKVERLPGNIGYIDTSGFVSPEFAKRPIAAAMEFVAETDALIIDMRNNGGGSPETVQFFCSYFFNAEKPVHLNSLYFRQGDTTEEFWTLKDIPGKRYVDKPVYVLCSKRTGSAAEEFCYNLQNLKRSTLIGENTWGGANPGGVVRLNDHFSMFVPSGRAINPYTKTNWEGTGVTPEVKANPAEAMRLAHEMAIKKLLESASNEKDRARLEQVLQQIRG